MNLFGLTLKINNLTPRIIFRSADKRVFKAATFLVEDNNRLAMKSRPTPLFRQFSF